MGETKSSVGTYVHTVLTVTAAIFLFLAVGFVSIVIAWRSETSESFYPTLAEAELDGAIQRGWIPPWVPLSSTDIHEIHDIDSNRTYISLRYAASDDFWFQFICQTSNTAPPDPGPRVSWWQPGRPWNAHMFFECFNEDFDTRILLAIDSAVNRALLWSDQ